MKTKRGFLVVTTGVSCCGRKEVFLPGFEKMCEDKGKKIKIYDIGRMIFGWARSTLHENLPKDNILFVNDLAMRAMHAVVMHDIKNSLQKDLEENDVVMVNMHTSFRWWKGGVSINIANEPFLMEWAAMGIIPAMFVSFIDNGIDILGRLNNTNQWKDQLTEKDVYLWQHEEVNATQNYRAALLKLAELMNFPVEDIKFFVMPIRQPPETLYYLIFESWRPVIYAQMPITHVPASKLQKVVNFIKQLRESAVVFDPMTIETGIVDQKMIEKGGDEEIMVRHNQTGYRDTHWFIPQCGLCVSYYVIPKPSVGVSDETVVGSELGKEMWSIFPGTMSPFVPFRAHRIFKSPDECLKHFRDVFLLDFQKPSSEETVPKGE